MRSEYDLQRSDRIFGEIDYSDKAREATNETTWKLTYGTSCLTTQEK